MQQEWWHNSIVYQIYPQSFLDTNGDGFGDLQGIIQKLNYLENLGINTIWLCPTFPSPMVDCGYDISDYKGVHSRFGNIADMDELICKAEEKGIKILLDLVLNHTSDQHPWFVDAINNANSKYKDYYIFKKSNDEKPPNNWRANFGGSAWEHTANSDYYMHSFAPEQPDLNWENPAMRKELYDMVKWWLNRGIAGFRIDAICFIKKDQSYASLPADGPDGLASLSLCGLAQPGIELFLAELRDSVFKPNGTFTVAEANGITTELLKDYIGENGYFSIIFDFSYTDIDIKNGNWFEMSDFTMKDMQQAIISSQRAISDVGHGAPYLENHDQNRSPNKYLNTNERNYEGKTMLGVLYFFLQGVPFIYQGQELGFTNYPWTSLEEFADVACKDQFSKAIAAGYSKQDAFAFIANRARDNSRTPMLWNSTKNAGFTAGNPWLPIHPDYLSLNAEFQLAQEKSVFNFYKSMVALRKEYSILFFKGSFSPIFEDKEGIFAYKRVFKQNEIWVICNTTPKEQPFHFPHAHILLSNSQYKDTSAKNKTHLNPFEAIVIKPL